MIQPLQPSRVSWALHWVELQDPIPSGADYILPILLMVCGEGGMPVSTPILLEELDQQRVESHLLRLFDTEGAPDRIHIAACEDWDEEAWRAFSKEQNIEIRFHRSPAEIPGDVKALAVSVVRRSSGEETAPRPTPQNIAQGLLRAALRMRSPRRREALLRAALEHDPDCSGAYIELADAEFQKGNWKAGLEAYDRIISLEARRWEGQSPDWWRDPATRPYLRALYGRAMTLWHRGHYTETATQLEALLALNPRDNQGARFFIPMIHLLAGDLDAAAAAFASYQATYPGDYLEPTLLFGWGLSLSLGGDEAAARKKYHEGILRNIYIAPLLLEESAPTRILWLPSDRAEPAYASEFADSYAGLWDRESGALRILREAWDGMRDAVAALVSHRKKMLDFQDQRYEPEFKAQWQALLDEDDRLSGSH